jgi:hypothetical protein
MTRNLSQQTRRSTVAITWFATLSLRPDAQTKLLSQHQLARYIAVALHGNPFSASPSPFRSRRLSGLHRLNRIQNA